MAVRGGYGWREPRLAFETLSIEGGLLSPEWLAKVVQLRADTQTDADYRIQKGLNLRDEIGRFWRIGQAHWADFASARNARNDAKAISDRFVAALLRDALGFSSLTSVSPCVIAEQSFPIGRSAVGVRVPVVIAPADAGLDTPLPSFGHGNRRRSAFGLAQEYLNAESAALWGIASDGCTLRIVRDNASFTRPAWIEADLQRIFTEERYSDFAALWLLTHETRFGRDGQPIGDCALERWRLAGREEGTRAREHLRRGVEEALVALGDGFLSHPDNQALRAELASGELSTKAYFNQLLRLVYRLIFLLTVEERGLLHPDGALDVSTSLYERGYSLCRLRERSVKRSAHDRFSDLWEGLKIVLRGLAVGEPRLALPALAGIFAVGNCRALDSAKLENRSLLLALFKLAWMRDDTALARVNWRDMGPEELGSVYESLLELKPEVADAGRRFRISISPDAEAHARRFTGSYYTPERLVGVLLDRALDPVISEALAANPGREADTLLNLAIVDPACGSGHFLLAAGRRIASKIAELRAGGTPSASEYRHAVRQVVGRCLFGADLNPLAVELCKVSLWMEALEPGRPLSFLDSHILLGNSLFGATPNALADGIPAAAWEAMEGDDAKVAKAIRKQSDRERSELALDLERAPQSTLAKISARASDVDAVGDDSLNDVVSKAARWQELVGSAAYEHQCLIADTYCSAFVWQMRADTREYAPTEARFQMVRANGQRAPAHLRNEVARLREESRFFHWHLAFPQVFARGGFDVVLGNPPWIAHAGRAAQPLEPGFKKFCKATYAAFAGYPTTHGMFVGLAARLLRVSGALGLIIPSSVSELPKYAPTRRAHDELCDIADALVDFGEGQFPGVTQPCMALISRRAVSGRRDDVAGAAWPMERPDLNETARALLASLATLPALPRDLFGERGFQSDAEAQAHWIEAQTVQPPYTFPLREGTDVREFEISKPRIYADPIALADRLRSPEEYRAVRLVVRNTARYPIAALSDGLGFRNSLLAGFDSSTWSAPALVAFLNSSLVRWQHFVRFRDARQPIMPQVKIGHLRSIPEPKRDLPAVVRRLDAIGERLSASNAGISADDRAALDAIVFDAFDVGADARTLVVEWHRQLHESAGRKRSRRARS